MLPSSSEVEFPILKVRSQHSELKFTSLLWWFTSWIAHISVYFFVSETRKKNCRAAARYCRAAAQIVFWLKYWDIVIDLYRNPLLKSPRSGKFWGKQPSIWYFQHFWEQNHDNFENFPLLKNRLNFSYVLRLIFLTYVKKISPDKRKKNCFFLRAYVKKITLAHIQPELERLAEKRMSLSNH